MIMYSLVFPSLLAAFLVWVLDDNLQTEEESKSGNVEVPLSPEESHVHLDLGVEVASVSVFVGLLESTLKPFSSSLPTWQNKLELFPRQAFLAWEQLYKNFLEP